MNSVSLVALTISVAGFTLTPDGGVRSQSDWSKLTPTASPGVLADHVLVHDVRGAVVFGGDTGAGLKNETWRFDLTKWTRLTTPNAPPARIRHAGAYDRARGRFVVFGGSTSLSGGLMNDTWEFNGTTWTKLSPTASPAARNDHAMCYDTVGKRVLLFGGRIASGDATDTWSWDGKTWTQITTKTSPPGRRDHSMVFDPVRGVALTYGGFFGSGLNLRSDTWEFTGSDWVERKPTTSPGTRVGYSLVHDELRGRTVLFSGYAAPGQPDDTWEWDGANWQRMNPANKPSGRSGHAMSYDWLRGHTILYGGWDNTHTGDTWIYGTASRAAFTEFGTACKGSAGLPALTLVPGKLPWIGDSFEIEIAKVKASTPVGILLGFSNTAWGALRLPLKLDGLGATGCTLYVSPDLVGLATTSGDRAQWALPIPNSTSLRGAQFYVQGLVIDPTINGFGSVFSNAGASTVGQR